MHREKFLQIIESEPLLNGRFENIERIDSNGGNGVFSLLLKAKDARTGEKVALKFYDPTKQHYMDRVQRFHREAKILKLLQDEPYVVKSLDDVCTLERNMIDSASGIEIPIILQYIPMLLADHNIEQLIYTQDPNPVQCLVAFKEMIKALLRVHRRRICHRDLKPSNFLVSGTNVWLSDFGTAKCMDGSMPDILSSYEDPVGDKRYIAPEILFSLGISDENVFTSDLFSMGAMLFEMFTLTTLNSQILGQTDIRLLCNLDEVLSKMSQSNRRETYRGIADQLARSMPLPDIYAYNDSVPGSIRDHLNELYKGLAAINFERRLRDPSAIHRKLDICLKILRNEKEYKAWLERKRRIRKPRNN